MGFTVLVFAAELQKVHMKCISFDFLERNGSEFQNDMYVEEGRKL